MCKLDISKLKGVYKNKENDASKLSDILSRIDENANCSNTTAEDLTVSIVVIT